MRDSSLAQELRTQADLVWIAASPLQKTPILSFFIFFSFGVCMLIISMVFFYLSYYTMSLSLLLLQGQH